MNSRMTAAAERLQIVQSVIARRLVATSPGATAILVVNAQIIPGAAPLTRKPVTFQCLPAVPAVVEIVACCFVIASNTFLGPAAHRAMARRCILDSGAIRAPCLRSAMIDVIGAAVGALVNRTADALTSFASTLGEICAGMLCSDRRHASRTHLLTAAGWLVGCTARFANPKTETIPGLSVRFECTCFAAFLVWRCLDKFLAAAWASKGPVARHFHRSKHSGELGIV